MSAGKSALQKSGEQANQSLLAIPGPIDVSKEVLQAIAEPPLSHVSPELIALFGDCIRMTRKVVDTKNGQPFLIAGSGTFGWDQVGANLVEPGDYMLVLRTGYFGTGIKECLETYGAKVDELNAPLGGTVDLSEIEASLRRRQYKGITITHVDTSTGVLSNAKAIAETVWRVSPDTLVVLDGVCSVGSEEIRMDAWGIDVIVTASQKGLGAPPGLSVVIASERALRAFASRRAPITSYYASWKKWIPIMKAYEDNKAAYFATPPVNLIKAYHVSLTEITKSQPSLDERYRLHKQASQRIKAIAAQLGMRQIAREPAEAANGMTAIYLPDGIKASDVLPRLAAKGVVMAGGLVADIKDKYIRIGHMGTSVVDANRRYIEKITESLTETLEEIKAERRGEVEAGNL